MNGWPRLVRDWQGLRARARREMRNAWGVIPPGAKVTITRAYRRSDLIVETERCSCCGLKALMSGIDQRDLDLLEPPVEGAGDAAAVK